MCLESRQRFQSELPYSVVFAGRRFFLEGCDVFHVVAHHVARISLIESVSGETRQVIVRRLVLAAQTRG